MREWLKTMRTEQGMTMKDLSRKLGISESYYCAIENGDRQKRMDLMLCHQLSVPFYGIEYKIGWDIFGASRTI